MRAALIGLLVLSIAACASRSEQRLQQLYDSATAQLWRGELTNASRDAADGIGLSAAQTNDVWSWRFKLLAAEIHLVGRESPDAGKLLGEPVPANAGAWVAAKHRYLEGQLAVLRGQLDEAQTVLDDASRLAKAASADDVSL